MLKKWSIGGALLLFIALALVVIILTCSISPFDVSVFDHVIKTDYFEAAALLFGVAGGALIARKYEE